LRTYHDPLPNGQQQPANTEVGRHDPRIGVHAISCPR